LGGQSALTERLEYNELLRESASSHPHGLHRPGKPKYIHDALEVVDQDLKTHFRAWPHKRWDQEVCSGHPVVERTEFMLDSPSADGHCIRLALKPTLHGFQNMLVVPSSDAAIGEHRSLRSQCGHPLSEYTRRFMSCSTVVIDELRARQRT